MALIWFILIGIAAGWLAGYSTNSKGGGLLFNLVIGVIGAVVGGFLFGLLGLSANSLLGELVTATIGAIVLIVLLRKVGPKSRRRR
jgi:uncharacterized membrane protein YeaQ/YmgE (transglycosylase-associated protein family)